MTQQTYTIRGMDCADCARTVEKGVRALTGVQAARVDFVTGKLHLDGDIAPEALAARLEALGYGLNDTEPTPTPPTSGILGGMWGFLRYLTRQPNTRLALAG